MDQGFAASGFTDVEEIGRGGFGTVYRARQAQFDRVVAVKVLHGVVATEDHHRIERECQAMGAVSTHPNIVTIYESGRTADGQAFLVMEYAPGGSLWDKVRRAGPLDWTEATAVGVSLAGALDVAHTHGRIHRDVKPENVLLSEFGVPMLADFGVALVNGHTRTRTSSLSFSIVYASPETLTGEAPTVRTDVYALGATLHAVLCGSPPFLRSPDDAVASLLFRVIEEAVPDLSQAGVPRELCGVLERAMAKDPASRFASAAELGSALQDLQRAAGLAVTPLHTAQAAQPRPAQAAQPRPLATPTFDVGKPAPSPSVLSPAPTPPPMSLPLGGFRMPTTRVPPGATSPPTAVATPFSPGPGSPAPVSQKPVSQHAPLSAPTASAQSGPSPHTRSIQPRHDYSAHTSAVSDKAKTGKALDRWLLALVAVIGAAALVVGVVLLVMSDSAPTEDASSAQAPAPAEPSTTPVADGEPTDAPQPPPPPPPPPPPAPPPPAPEPPRPAPPRTPPRQPPAAPAVSYGDLSRSWILVFDSLDKSSNSYSDAAAQAGWIGDGAQVIDSSEHPGLNPGYWAVVAGPFDSKREAESGCSWYGRPLGGECYPRFTG